MGTVNVTTIEELDPEEEKTLATINDNIESISYPNNSDKIRAFQESDDD